jgi:hypothetical protein
MALYAIIENNRSISMDELSEKIGKIRRLGPVQTIKRDGGSPLTIDILDIKKLQMKIQSHSQSIKKRLINVTL